VNIDIPSLKQIWGPQPPRAPSPLLNTNTGSLLLSRRSMHTIVYTVRWHTIRCAATALRYTARQKKVKEVDLYSAFIVVPHTEGAQVRITVLPANYTVPASVL